ncbi:MAG: polysaccharide deacetylase family protein, partial [Planctomycetes bacterium]|nr:polysaccharide deacetylase family protein [Planctomycetota bacterium]
DTAGVTIHAIDAGLDTGAILAQRAVQVAPFATVAGLLAELDLVASEVLAATECRLAAGTVERRGQGQATTPTRGRPPFLLARGLYRRLRRRRSRTGPREWLKNCVFFAYARILAPLRNRLRATRGGCHTTILLYHRISDRWLDAVTAGVEQFDRQLELLRSRYEVLDLAEYLRRRGEPCRRPRVVLTFDDGYADNHLAAMLLRRAGLPCTFFISTSIVGSDRGFEHDLNKLRQVVPALSWDQVRQMADRGFGFGNHTRHHSDLGSLPVDEALSEVRLASAKLVQELGARGGERWLAFPFGRRKNMTPELRAKLDDAGIDHCLSAFGGVNPPDFDPLDIRREGVSSGVSDAGLLALVEGWGAR